MLQELFVAIRRQQTDYADIADYASQSISRVRYVARDSAPKQRKERQNDAKAIVLLLK